MKKFCLLLGDDLMNPNNSNIPNTIGIKIGLPNSSNKGFDIKAGIIESAPNTPYNPNNNLKLYDSKDEIVFEVKHKLIWLNYIVSVFLSLFGSLLILGILGVMFDGEIGFNFVSVFFLLIGFVMVLFPLKGIFYQNKNRFYITHQGIGFERRHYFRMQKRFFKFGEVGVIVKEAVLVAFIAGNTYFFNIFPLGHKRLNFKGRYFFSVNFWNVYYISPKLYDKITGRCYLHEFLVKKTKETLESQGIDTKTLPYNLDKQFDI